MQLRDREWEGAVGAQADLNIEIDSGGAKREGKLIIISSLSFVKKFFILDELFSAAPISALDDQLTLVAYYDLVVLRRVQNLLHRFHEHVLGILLLVVLHQHLNIP